MPIRKETKKRQEIVETEEIIEIPECDFCGQDFPEENSDFLNTVLLNPEIKSKTEEVVIVDKPKSRGLVMGIPEGELYKALGKSEIIDWDRKNSVQRMVNQEFPLNHPAKAEFRTDRDKSAYSFTINTNAEQKSEAEIEVCDYCKEVFNNDK